MVSAPVRFFETAAVPEWNSRPIARLHESRCWHSIQLLGISERGCSAMRSDGQSCLLICESADVPSFPEKALFVKRKSSAKPKFCRQQAPTVSLIPRRCDDSDLEVAFRTSLEQ
jgi:hypothetical protein